MEAILESYLQAGDPRSREDSLSDLMEMHAQPILRRVVAARLSGLWDDIDDVCSEARLELLLHLRRLTTSGVAPISDFPAYVATVAANACRQYFRRRHPGRARLKKQIRFLVLHEPELTSRSSADGRFLCDLAGRSVLALEVDPDLEDLASRVEGERDLGRLLVQVLQRAGSALDLDQMTDLVARVWRIPADREVSRSDVDLNSIPASASEGEEAAIDRRRFTARLWLEICQLPRAQRAALLLHLRDHRGNSVLFLFQMCGVASLAQIAAAVEMPADQLRRLWNELPADDNSIAELLGCARQRVINLRMAARKRLTNRMSGLR